MSFPSRSDSMLLFLALVACFSSQLFTAVNGEILSYSNHEITHMTPEYLKIPKYAEKDVPNWSPGNGRSFIDFSDLRLEAICGDEDMKTCGEGSNFEVLMLLEETVSEASAPSTLVAPDESFDDDAKVAGKGGASALQANAKSTMKGWMDYWPEHEFCCTANNLERGLCRENERNKLIVPINLPGAYVVNVALAANKAQKIGDTPIVTHHDIQKSGVYIIIFASCDEGAAPVLLNGTIESLDPYGYLPADLFGNLPFFEALMCMYTLLAIYWVVVCGKYMQQLIQLQYWIGIVILFGMIESTAMYAHYEHWNKSGNASLGILTTGLIAGISKRTFSRITLVLLSLGYGIVKPNIGDDMGRAMKLGLAYFVASLCYVLATIYPSRHASTGGSNINFLTFLVLLQAAIDTVFYIWIIQSINALLSSLAARQQGMKYLLYRNFRASLFLALFCAIVWGLYSALVIFDDSGPNGSDASWQFRWTVDALWESIYLVIFVAIAHLWAPTANSQRYAYSVELAQLDDDEEYTSSSHNKLPRAPRSAESDLDAEYGGALHDEEDPFSVGSGGGALDTASAISKSQ